MKHIRKKAKDLLLEERKQESLDIRIKAAQIARDGNTPTIDHNANRDEKLPFRLMSFTKGLLHHEDTGLLKNEEDFEKLVEAIKSGDPKDFEKLKTGEPGQGQQWLSEKANENKVNFRAWESAGAGLTYDLQGPDAQAVTMPPAPRLGSNELIAEIAEVYCQALLRDKPLSAFNDASSQDNDINDCVNALRGLVFFAKQRRKGIDDNQGREQAVNTVFRGFTKGDLVGPYLSQFMLAGNNGLNTQGTKPTEFDASEGYINYGSITIDQRVRVAKEVNYLIDWEEYVDVQNGANFGRLEEYTDQPTRRFITTGRDLATYVHYDALYEAYLNACLLLLSVPNEHKLNLFDEGVPFQGPDSVDKQQGFAHYGGPHILTLVTEVATRALKAVRFQKFNTHRRLRPEALAARMEKFAAIIDSLDKDQDKQVIDDLKKTHKALKEAGVFKLLRKNKLGNKNLLLPMAFQEGSPMHPAYGAGHATVAGACVTILKAFFNHKLYVKVSADGAIFDISDKRKDAKKAFVPPKPGAAQDKLLVVDTEPLTLVGEINKLAANISIGRDWAGVHYYTDYTESMLLGEEIAIKLLQEQAITYNPLENFHMTLPKFDGTEIMIAAPKASL